MSPRQVFTALPKGKNPPDRQAELISLDGWPTFVITDPRYRAQAPDVLRRIRVRTIRQYETIDGRKREITLLAPVTIAQLKAAGITEQDLRNWRLLP